MHPGEILLVDQLVERQFLADDLEKPAVSLLAAYGNIGGLTQPVLAGGRPVHASVQHSAPVTGTYPDGLPVLFTERVEDVFHQLCQVVNHLPRRGIVNPACHGRIAVA